MTQPVREGNAESSIAVEDIAERVKGFTMDDLLLQAEKIAPGLEKAGVKLGESGHQSTEQGKSQGMRGQGRGAIGGRRGSGRGRGFGQTPPNRGGTGKTTPGIQRIAGSLAELIRSASPSALPPPPAADPDLEDKVETLSVASSRTDEELIELKEKTTSLEAKVLNITLENQALFTALTNLQKEVNGLTARAAGQRENQRALQTGRLGAHEKRSEDIFLLKTNPPSTNSTEVVVAPKADKTEQEEAKGNLRASRKKNLE